MSWGSLSGRLLRTLSPSHRGRGTRPIPVMPHSPAFSISSAPWWLTRLEVRAMSQRSHRGHPMGMLTAKSPDPRIPARLLVWGVWALSRRRVTKQSAYRRPHFCKWTLCHGIRVDGTWARGYVFHEMGPSALRVGVTASISCLSLDRIQPVGTT